LTRKPPATAKFDRAVTELLLLKPGRFSEIKTDNVHLIKSDGEKEAEEAEENSKEDDKADEDVANDQKRRKAMPIRDITCLGYSPLKMNLCSSFGQLSYHSAPLGNR
jgi:hypothetical protein